jgi:hypothetical protein
METIQGQRTKLELISYSHGSIRVPLAQALNYTPKITARTINEFDNLEAAMIVTTYDSTDVTFDYFDSDSKLVDAIFADSNPAATVVVDDPSDYRRVYLMANVKALNTGKIFASILAKACVAKGAPYTEPVLEEAKVTRDLTGTNCIKVKGSAMYYQRMLASSPAVSVYQQAVPPNINVDLKFPGSGPFTVTNAKTALQFDGVNYYAVVLKNGVEVTTGFTMTSTTFTVPTSPATTDIWEAYYLYADV